MNIDKLKIFTQSAFLGSITEAAASLGYTQSGASHLLTSLETELGGVRLLTRGRSGCRLTVEGERLLPLIEQIVRTHGRLIQEARTLAGGLTRTLRVAVFTSVASLWLPRVLESFRGRCPDAAVETLGASYAEMEKWLRDGEADCCFCRLPVGRGLRAWFLADDPLVCVLPPGHRLADRPSVSLTELDGEEFVRPTTDRFNDVSRLLVETGVRPRFRHIVHDYHSVLSAVSQGQGLSVVPLMMTSLVEQPQIVRPIAENPRRSIGIAVRDGETLPPLTETFVAVTRELFEKGDLPWSGKIGSSC